MTRSKKAELTEGDLRFLKIGAENPDGVIRNPYHAGWEKTVGRRRIEKLVRLGLAVPNAHGDHYVTEAGREAAKALYIGPDPA